MGGRRSPHHGRHYTLEGARLYSLLPEPPPILVSGFGPNAVELAAQIGDGFVSVGPDGEGLERYRRRGGRGPATSGLKVCWGEDRAACVRTAHRLWPNEALGGELAQVLPSPRHFEQATALATEEHISEAVACGSDPEEHVAAIQEVVDAGFDEVYVGHIGPDHAGFVDFYAREVLPHLAGASARSRQPLARQPSTPVAECGAPTGLDSGEPR